MLVRFRHFLYGTDIAEGSYYYSHSKRVNRRFCKNGIREDGSVYALYSFARKLGQALTSGLSGALLSMIGYKKSTAFDKNVVEGIFDISTLLPAISFILLALILWFWYPLKKKLVDENVEFLRQKHNK